MAAHLRLPSLNLHTRGVSTTSVESDSSDSSPDHEHDEETEYFMVNANDSQSTLGPIPISKDDEMHVDEDLQHRLTPISKLPPELLIAIFSKLTTTSDLRNCMLVSYHWALYCVSILWHRPLCNKWPNLQNVARTLADSRPTFPYSEMVKRLNLSAVAEKVSNGTAQAFNKCKSIERLTLTSCSKLSDSGVTGLVDGCKRLQALDVTDLSHLTDATLLAVARNCAKLQGLNITNCINISDESLVAIAENCRQLKRLKLNGVFRATDQSVISIARNCRSILEVDLAGCNSITSESVTALLSNLPHLRELRLAHCADITDSAFTNLPPKLQFDSLRILDLTQCEQVRDDAIARIIPAAPRLRNLVLAKCRHITDRAVESICKLTKNLHYIHLGHCTNLTDAAVINLVKHCNRIRYIDLACCSRLTDASVRHLAQLPKLRRIGLVKCQNLTDSSILALAHGPLIVSSSGKIGLPSQFVSLERVHLSYCLNLTLKGITALLHHCPRLTHLSLTGVQAFLREDLTRFCREAPPEFTHPQRDVFCVFSGEGVIKLRDYLTRLAIAEAEREHQNEIEESLIDSEDSPGADTMSDDGTIDGNDQGMDIVYGPGRHGFPSIMGARRMRPRSMQNLSGQHVDVPFFDHDQMQRAGSWTPGGHLVPETRSNAQPAQFGMIGSNASGFANVTSQWQNVSLTGDDREFDEAIRSRNQNRRHTLESSGLFPPSANPAFHPYVSSATQLRDMIQDPDLFSPPNEPSTGFNRLGTMRPSRLAARYETLARELHLQRSTEQMAFDANHDAIMSTIPDGNGSELGNLRSESSLQSRANARQRMSHILGGMRNLSASPLTYAEFASRSSRSGRSRDGSRHRNDAHREAIFRAMMAADVGESGRNQLPPVAPEGDVSMPLLPRELMEQVPSSPATSTSSTRAPTPLIQTHPPDEDQNHNDDHDVTMTQ